MTSVSVSHVYTVVIVRTYTMTSPVTARRVGRARDVKQLSVIAALVFARMVLHATMYSRTTSVSECCVRKGLCYTCFVDISEIYVFVL